MTPENALHRTAALCSRSEQCEADLRLKLTAWGIGCDDADAIIARLKTGNFLCDNRYAHAFVRDKFRFGGKYNNNATRKSESIRKTYDESYRR